ncbi:hypothetical protein CPB84DRAFT_1850189 [Gymnopilus junonius]|uniref:Uncharacterized protein n=1 Tax=Gymnopilus junonius TaxID=109634 RepID=A0A9P5TIU7_GYMJU|nr:hypothetical protein CPB84DRAFT_1850189 [Gymnopilus junonius]
MSSQPSSSAPLSFLDQEMLFLNQPDGTPPASPSLTGTFSALTPQNAFSATLSGTQNNSPVYPYHAMMYPPQMLAQPNYSQQSTFPQTPLPPSMLQTIPSYYSGNILFPQAHNLPLSLGVFNPNGPATNAVSTQPPTKRKRQTTTSSGRSGKHQKKNSAAVVTEITPSPHCGVGPPSVVPLAQAEVVHQTSNSLETSSSALTVPESASMAHASRRYHDLPAAATDVWYFLRALETDVEPAMRPTDEVFLTYKPKTKFVGCKLCTKWKVWQNNDGMMSCFRDHFKKIHSKIYYKTISIKNLKHAGMSIAAGNVGLPKFSSVQFSAHFGELRTELLEICQN